MPTPLRTEQPKRVVKPLVSQSGPSNTTFKQFGTLDIGRQDGRGPLTSIVLNVVAAFVLFVIWKASPPPARPKTVENITFVKEPPPPLPPPKLPPPPKIKMPPPPPVVEPKVVLPKVTVPDPPKVVTPPTPKPQPTPAVKPMPAKLSEAPPAPKVTNVNLGHAASVPNQDPHPSAVSLGHPDNPIAVSNRPATAAVNLGNAGLQGMPPGSGRGPNSTAVNLGSGSPKGSNLNATGAVAVAGIPHGYKNGNGTQPGNGIGVQQATLGQRPPVAAVVNPGIPKASLAKGPAVLSQPKPQYTADATANHIEGTIRVKIRVSATGQVTVLGVVGGGLGHGLDQSALTAAQGIRFRPAVDANGNPTDWEGVVSVLFQIAT